MVDFYVSVRSSLVSSLVLIFLLFDASSYAAQVVDVNTICNQTETPSFCLSLLNSKPGGAAGADLVTLDEYTIRVLQANVTNTIKLLKSLIANSSDPKAKDHYEMCLTQFLDGEDKLAYAQKLLKSGDYAGVSMGVNDLIQDVDECTDSPSNPPYQDPSLLPEYAYVIREVFETFMVITNYLLGG